MIIRQRTDIGIQSKRRYNNFKKNRGWHFIPGLKFESVPRPKGTEYDKHGERFGVCNGCKFYNEKRDIKNGVVFVIRRWCMKHRNEVSNLGDMKDCIYKEVSR